MILTMLRLIVSHMYKGNEFVTHIYTHLVSAPTPPVNQQGASMIQEPGMLLEPLENVMRSFAFWFRRVDRADHEHEMQIILC